MVMAAIAVVVVCFVWSVVSFVVQVPHSMMMRMRTSPKKSQMIPQELTCPVVVHHLVLHEHESLYLVSGNLMRFQVVAEKFQIHP